MTLALSRDLRATLRRQAEARRMRGLVAEWCLLAREQLRRGRHDDELEFFFLDLLEVHGGAVEMHREGPSD